MSAQACSPPAWQTTWRRDASATVLAARAPWAARRAGSNGGYAAAQAARAARGRRALQVQAFSLLKNLNVPKPRWMPDLGRPKRCAVLDEFFNISDGATRPTISREVYESLLAPDFRFTDQSRGEEHMLHQYFRADFIELMCGCVAPALPNFSWSAATDGEADRDGYCIVEVQISAHHTGAPLALPGLPEVPPSGRRVALEPEYLRVRVEGEKIKEIVVLPSKVGAGPLALYRTLAGEPPMAPA